jgi:polysaccharide export outer membrane protein
MPYLALIARTLRFASCLMALLLTAGCGSRPAVVAKTLPSPIKQHRQEVLDRQLVQDIVGERDGEAYRVGPGDTLLVAVYGHPELSIAPYAGAGSLGADRSRLSGLAIDNDGSIQFPLIGTVQVAGKTSAQLRTFLEQELARYVKEPNVTVQVVFTGSIRYYLLGEFTQPGLKYSDRPLRLLEALSLGGSVELEKASLSRAYVARSGKRLPINFLRLVRQGDLSQNLRLRSGDVIVVPDNTSERAYVFGGASGSNPRGGTVSFVNGQLTLLQALAQVGFGTTEQVQGKLSETYVIRSEADRGELFVIDAERLMQGEAADFPLAPGDVVYVPPTWVTSWNQVLSQLLPTLQTISGVLAPFVQIKYLSE